MPEKSEKTFTMDEVNALVSRNTELFFEKFAPYLEKIALTPEKMREFGKPYIDPEIIARKNHERKEFQEQERNMAKDTAARQAACRHQDKKGYSTICLQRNFHDNMPRGLCTMCQLVIHPHHWDWRPVTLPDGSIESKAQVVPAHPLYYIVQEMENSKL